MKYSVLLIFSGNFLFHTATHQSLTIFFFHSSHQVWHIRFQSLVLVVHLYLPKTSRDCCPHPSPVHAKHQKSRHRSNTPSLFQWVPDTNIFCMILVPWVNFFHLRSLKIVWTVNISAVLGASVYLTFRGTCSVSAMFHFFSRFKALMKGNGD